MESTASCIICARMTGVTEPNALGYSGTCSVGPPKRKERYAVEAGNTPVVGTWYETQDGSLFMVLAYDKARGLVDIQYASGPVDQMDAQTWAELEAEEVEPPEEWHRSMDDFPAGRRQKPK